MPKARLTLDPSRTSGAIDRRLFGSFVEHMGRCVYDGIYEPTHPTADEFGFREDVMELVRELGVTTIRYPGGNFVSGYQWEDGVGPRDERPVRADLAWHSTETNRVGLHEFAGWLERLGGNELMYAVNLGTRGVREALDVLEYANLRSGTTISDQRIANGRGEPFGITMWCLGNEMDGPWQLGHRSAEDYGKLASMTAKAMRQLDHRIQLVVCGSSSAQMPTFGAWERTVLEHTFDDVDFISCHAYYEPIDGDLTSFLASAVNMDGFIDTVVRIADEVAALRGSDKRITVSFDEWNVWQLSKFEAEKTVDIDVWPVAPRLIEDAYSVLDAVVVGGLLISLLRHADRVTSASMAQLVNVIAPIMTEPGGPVWRQTIFHPFAVTARLAVGVALDVQLSSDKHVTGLFGEVDSVDAVASHDAESGAVAVFLVNRSESEEATVTVDLRALGDVRISETHLLADDDIRATNTVEDQFRVVLAENPTARITDGMLTVSLPPVSWSAIGLRLP